MSGEEKPFKIKIGIIGYSSINHSVQFRGENINHLVRKCEKVTKLGILGYPRSYVAMELLIPFNDIEKLEIKDKSNANAKQT